MIQTEGPTITRRQPKRFFPDSRIGNKVDSLQSDENDFNKLCQIATSILDLDDIKAILNEYKFNNDLEKLITQITNIVDQKFQFSHKSSTGFGTLKKQLVELMNDHNDFERKQRIDCKLPTTILGLIFKELIRINTITETEVFMISYNSAHPYLIIANQASEYFKISFDNRRSLQTTTENMTAEEIYKNANSIASIDKLGIYAIQAVKERAKRIELTLEGIMELDRLYLTL